MRVEAAPSTRILLAGDDVTGRLREAEVEANVSAYSAVLIVRTAMVARQRALAEDGRIVVAGRDIGSVVLPGAPVKLFLAASEEERQRRRHGQDQAVGETRNAGASAASVADRDRVDSTRAVSPLVVPEGAVVIETTGVPVESVIAAALAVARGSTSGTRAPKGSTVSGPETGVARNRGRWSPFKKFRQYFRLATFFPPFYWTAQYLLRLILFGLVRYRCVGRENVPREGAVMLVSNHLNDTDPFMLCAALSHRRRIRFMAKKELFTGPLGWVAKLYGAFPVRRGEADIGAMLAAERLLKRGEVIGMFPEGTRSRTGYMGPPHGGTALIAVRAGATVLPAGITGTERIHGISWIWRRPVITVKLGEPFALAPLKRPSEEQVSELTNRIVTSIESLLPPAYVRSYTQREGTEEETDGGDPPRE